MRERIILEDLRDSEAYLSLDYFANRLGVSTRTIRNEIKNIEAIQSRNGFKLEHRQKLGYVLNISDIEKFNHYLKKLPLELIESPEQRIESIIVELLVSEYYITIEQLSEKFLVSASQIKNDLKKIDEKLRDTYLNLERKARYGIKIRGSIDSNQNLLTKIYLNQNRKILEYRNQFIDKSELTHMISSIKNILNKNNLEANTPELKEISSQVVIFCIKANLRRLKKTSMPKVYINDIIIKDLMKEIFKDTGCYISSKEKDYLKQFIYLKTKNKKYKVEYVDKNMLQDIIHNFFEGIDKKYRTSFLEDKEFFNLLYLHIASLIERVKREQSLKNPFSIKISQQYPTVFNLAIQLSKVIECKYNIKISQDEIGFIATHIAVPFEKREEASFNKEYKIAIICSSGGGSAYLIKLRLKEIFPKADIKNFSLLDEDNVIKFDPDLIFSITNLSLKTKAPVVLINEILDELDYLNIKERVILKDNIGVAPNPKQYILSLFSKNHFIIITKNIEYKKVLKNMSQKIVDEGACSKSYIKDVWERESYLSTIYTNGVAIPHPIEMTGNKNILSVALIKSDISYENKKPKIIFMVSLIKDNLELHKQISKYLTKIMLDKDIVDMLNKSQTYEEFMYKLKMCLGG